jgi:hypothetical protein
MDQQSPKCPIHGVYLTPIPTKCGVRWNCHCQDCTVVWWGSRNATPADYETRKARGRAHTAMSEAMEHRNLGEAELYRAMKLDLNVDHIGLCDLETCEKIIEWARTL